MINTDWTFPCPFQRMRILADTGWDAVTVPGAVSAWVALERGFAAGAAAELRRLGLAFEVPDRSTACGGAQLIWRLAEAGYGAASEPRKEGQAAGL